MIVRRGWYVWGLAALIVVTAILVTLVVLLRKPAATPAPQPISVSAATASVQDIPISIVALGAAQAWTSATVFAQVSGMLVSVDFAEGAYVKAGQLLAQIDPAPYRAALTQAQGALKRDQALLAGARVDLARYKTLAAQDSIARQTFDDQAALVQEDEGTVLLDEGAVATAEVNLRWCRIVSPITGRAGVRTVDPGNLVTASGTTSTTSGTTGTTTSPIGIVIINQIEPIAVTFSVPQGDYQRLAKASSRFSKPLATQALSQETGASLGTGELSIADNRVNPATGTVEMKARFANTDELLLPGQFVYVRLTLQTLSHVTTIPIAAVNQGPDGAFAYVIGADRKVSMQPIKVESTEGATAVIATGIEPGQIVVIDGQMTLSAGSEVKIKVSPPTPAKAPAS